MPDAIIHGFEGTPSIYEVFNKPWPRTLGERVLVNEEVYFYFLNIMPPIFCEGGFMVSEPDSDQEGGIVFSKFTESYGKYYHEWAVVPRRSA